MSNHFHLLIRTRELRSPQGGQPLRLAVEVWKQTNVSEDWMARRLGLRSATNVCHDSPAAEEEQVVRQPSDWPAGKLDTPGSAFPSAIAAPNPPSKRPSTIARSKVNSYPSPGTPS